MGDLTNKTDYIEFLNGIFESLEEDPFYGAFANNISSGKNNLNVYRRINRKKLDRAWIDIIDDTIINLDNIVRKPRLYIAREEEIVPIELSRSITTESVKHLAQHTNMIAEIDEDDNIIPNKILNINKEESYEMYENRFVYTLLLKLKDFVDKRAKLIEESEGNESAVNVNLESKFKFGDKDLDFQIKLKSSFIGEEDAEEDNQKFISDCERVKKIQTIINTFLLSPFAKTMSRYALVKPPITRTNVILKNPDFKKALILWQFVNTYEKLGYEVHSTETLEDIAQDSHEIVIENNFLNYLFYYNIILLNQPKEKITRKSKINPKFVKKFVEQAVSEGLVDDVEIQNVIRDGREKKTRFSIMQEEAINRAIDRALLADEEYLRQKQKERERQEKLEAEEKARKEAERRAEIEKAREERMKEREEARLAKEAEEARRLQEEAEAKAKEEAKQRILEELRLRLFKKFFKTDKLVELAQKKALELANNPNTDVENDEEIKQVDDEKIRISLANLIRMAADFKDEDEAKEIVDKMTTEDEDNASSETNDLDETNASEENESSDAIENAETNEETAEEESVESENTDETESGEQTESEDNVSEEANASNDALEEIPAEDDSVTEESAANEATEQAIEESVENAEEANETAKTTETEFVEDQNATDYVADENATEAETEESSEAVDENSLGEEVVLPDGKTDEESSVDEKSDETEQTEAVETEDSASNESNASNDAIDDGKEALTVEEENLVNELEKTEEIDDEKLDKIIEIQKYKKLTKRQRVAIQKAIRKKRNKQKNALEAAKKKEIKAANKKN